MADTAPTESLPQIVDAPPQEEAVGKSRPTSKARRFAAWLAAPDSKAIVLLGLLVVVAGFAVIAYSWGKVAGLLSVPLQLPYFASGGFVGLALIVLGVGIVSIGVKRRDNFDRVRELQKLAATMESIHGAVASSGSDGQRDRA